MADKQPDGGTVMRPFGLPTSVGALVPLILLGIVVAGFLLFPPFAGIGGEPLPDVTVTHATLPSDQTIVLHVTNNGPNPVRVSQVLVADAYWSFSMTSPGDPQTLQPLESGTVEIPYHWNPGWDLDTALVLSDGTTIHHTIVAPQPTPGVSASILWTLAVVGFFVGVLPVALGMLWYPFMRSLTDRTLNAILAFSAGVLAFLALDAGIEAVEIAESMPGAYDGFIAVILAAVGALVLVQAVGARGGDATGLRLAYLVALGVGLHNLAEGLAIGGAFAIGRVSLGAFLVIGFMIHNVTEGPAVVAPVAREERPALWHFAALGLLAGAPVILGGWIGGFALTPTLGAIALAIGVGAIVQVDWEIASMIRRRGRLGTPVNLLAVLAGLVVMYATDLFVAL